MKFPPLNSLKVFEATARHLSFSRAADELFVTHAAVSHQIRKLEEWFQTDLFLRRGRSVELTRSGDMLFEHLSPALAELAETCGRVKALAGRDTLTVGCIPSLASRWLVPNLADFTANHPELDVTVVYAMANQKLFQSGLNVMITLGREDDNGISSKRLFSRITKPVCSPAFLQTYGPFDRPDKITSIPLLHDENREGWREWFKKASVAWSGNDRWPVYQDFNLLVTAAIAGHGAALCPVDAYRQEIERGDLVVISDLAVNEDAAYFVSNRKNAGPATIEFVKWFIAVAMEAR